MVTEAVHTRTKFINANYEQEIPSPQDQARGNEEAIMELQRHEAARDRLKPTTSGGYAFRDVATARGLHRRTCRCEGCGHPRCCARRILPSWSQLPPPPVQALNPR